MLPSFFEHELMFRYSKVSRLTGSLLHQLLESVTSKEICPFHGERHLETKIWVLGVPIALGVITFQQADLGHSCLLKLSVCLSLCTWIHADVCSSHPGLQVCLLHFPVCNPLLQQWKTWLPISTVC